VPSAAAIPIPSPPSSDPATIALGKKLFNEPLFAKNLSFSCASCHQLNNAGMDGLPKYIGMNKTVGDLNTPTVFNSSLNFRQFWDGRVKTLAEVVNDHVSDKTIFANDWDTIIQQITDNSLYSADFKKIYSDGVNQANINDALTTYIENLLTPNSNFDRFLKGDHSALSSDAQEGYELFIRSGCITCHQGPNLGGNLFQRLGIYKNYFQDKDTIKKADYGLFNVTGKEEDKFVFKVPSLRNITLTGPYLHDGSIKTLPEIIQIMAIYQVGHPLRSDEINSIVLFLESLTAEPSRNLLEIKENK
jgi:cytochrome c peroxidase